MGIYLPNPACIPATREICFKSLHVSPQQKRLLFFNPAHIPAIAMFFFLLHASPQQLSIIFSSCTHPRNQKAYTSLTSSGVILAKNCWIPLGRARLIARSPITSYPYIYLATLRDNGDEKVPNPATLRNFSEPRNDPRNRTRLYSSNPANTSLQPDLFYFYPRNVHLSLITLGSTLSTTVCSSSIAFRVSSLGISSRALGG